MHQVKDELDVLVVGAGISGIGLAYYLKRDCPDKTFEILEARDSIGGTWDLFKYPGIRSDSDLHTFGYEFKPWKHEQSIADGHLILNYLRETVAEFGIGEHIRFQHKVIAANWSSKESRWVLKVACPGGYEKVVRAKWFFCAAGYYKYDEGFTPKFPGIEDYKGKVVHPQHWPENLDYTYQQVVVIGSGATAVTLIPAMAEKAAHITMLQRTPTYIMSLPSRDPVAEFLKKWLPERTAYRWIRRKNIRLQRLFWLYCQRFPNSARKLIRKQTARKLPAGCEVDVHFNPPYNPWDQRLCAVPNGDLFKTLRSGKASVVTDKIKTFEADGIRLESGRKLGADLVITATGLNIQLMGGIQMSVDGVPSAPSNHVTYKGMMMSDAPNFVFAIGYTNSSWTLKVGLLCEHFCRLINYMDERNLSVCTPKIPFTGMETRPILDFCAGYIQRASPTLPKQGFEGPWTMNMNYFADEKVLRYGAVADTGLAFR